MKISFVFAWYDFWIGIFIDKKKHRLYLFPVPMFGIEIQYGIKTGLSGTDPSVSDPALHIPGMVR